VQWHLVKLHLEAVGTFWTQFKQTKMKSPYTGATENSVGKQRRHGKWWNEDGKFLRSLLCMAPLTLSFLNSSMSLPGKFIVNVKHACFLAEHMAYWKCLVLVMSLYSFFPSITCILSSLRARSQSCISVGLLLAYPSVNYLVNAH
jgi:hypothetical protein